MTVELGTPHPLHAGGTGKSILAFLPVPYQQRVLGSGLDRLTPATITDPQRLAAELREIAGRGYAVSLGERQHDAGSVASPIFAGDGQVIGAISVCGPVGRFDSAAVTAYGELAVAAAAEISRCLGWTGAFPALPDDSRDRLAARQ